MTKNIYIIWFVLLSIVGIIFSGCAKFTATTTVDLTPFAEQTIAMLGNTDYGFTQNDL